MSKEKQIVLRTISDPNKEEAIVNRILERNTEIKKAVAEGKMTEEEKQEEILLSLEELFTAVDEE